MKITEICNMALSFIGKGSISSLNDDTIAAKQCKMFYDHTRHQLLRKYYFGFSRRLVNLALTEFEHPKWDYVYYYPSDCLFVRKVFNEEKEAKPLVPGMVLNGKREKFEVFLASGNVKVIGCNIEQAVCEYSYDVYNEDLFPDDFIDALAHMLAFNICLPLTGDGKLQEAQYQLAMASLREAMYTTAMEQFDELDYPTSYQDARR